MKIKFNGETREQWSVFRVPIRLNLVRNTRDKIRQVLVSFAHGCDSFARMERTKS